MRRTKIAVIIACSIFSIEAEAAQIVMPVPSPTTLNAKAPELSALEAKDAKAALATPQYCELKIGNELYLVASETGRQGVAVIGGSITTLRYPGPGPIRNGGRLFPSSPSPAVSLFIGIDNGQDKSLTKGIPRSALIEINGVHGGLNVIPATYTCNY